MPDNTLKNYGVYQSLVPVANVLTGFCAMVSDTRMLAGSNALTETLNYYDDVKGAAKRRVPGAKTVFDEMKSRYKKKKSKADKEKGKDGMEAVA